MNSAKESNLKSIAVISIVSILLFGIFYYLITDVSNSSSSPSGLQTNNTNTQNPDTTTEPQTYVASAETAQAPTQPPSEGEVEGDSTTANVIEPEKTEESVFKALSTQKMEKTDPQPGAVLGGSSQNAPESTVPATGSETIFAAFVVSSLIMFTGIYLLLTQPKNVALAKFEKRIIRELD